MSEHEGTTLLGAKVRRLREERGWTAPDLAQRAGLPDTTIDAIETGMLVAPNLEILLAIEKALLPEPMTEGRDRAKDETISLSARLTCRRCHAVYELAPGDLVPGCACGQCELELESLCIHGRSNLHAEPLGQGDAKGHA